MRPNIGMCTSAEKALRRAALSDPGLCDDESISATSAATGTVSLGDWGLTDISDDMSPLETALEALHEKRWAWLRCSAVVMQHRKGLGPDARLRTAAVSRAAGTLAGLAGSLQAQMLWDTRPSMPHSCPCTRFSRSARLVAQEATCASDSCASPGWMTAAPGQTACNHLEHAT